MPKEGLLGCHCPQPAAAACSLQGLGSATVSSRHMPPSCPWRLGDYKVPLDDGNFHYLLANLRDSASRREVLLAGLQHPSANLQLLDQIIDSRHEMAVLMGYGSYAEYKLHGTTLAGKV